MGRTFTRSKLMVFRLWRMRIRRWCWFRRRGRMCWDVSERKRIRVRCAIDSGSCLAREWGIYLVWRSRKKGKMMRSSQKMVIWIIRSNLNMRLRLLRSKRRWVSSRERKRFSSRENICRFIRCEKNFWKLFRRIVCWLFQVKRDQGKLRSLHNIYMNRITRVQVMVWLDVRNQGESQLWVLRRESQRNSGVN